MVKYLCVLFLGGISYSLFAQNTWTKQDSSEIFTSLSTAFKYAYKKPDTAKLICFNALQKAQKVNYSYGELKSLNIAGILQDVTGNNDSALTLYYKALQIALDLDDSKSQAQVGNNIGLIYWNTGKLDSALIWYKKSADIFEVDSDKKGLANAFNNMGLIYEDQNRQLLAMEYYHRSLVLRQEIADTFGIAASLHNLALAHTYLKDFDSAIYYGTRAMKLKEKINDKYGLSKTYHNLSIAYNWANIHDSAIVYSLKAIEIKEKINDWYGMASTLNNLSDIYMDEGRWKEAEQCASQGLEIAQKYNYQKVLEELYLNNAKIAFYNGDYKNAAIFRDSGMTYLRKNLKEKANKDLQELQVEYDVELKETKINALSKENEIKSLQLKQRNFALWTGGLGVILLSLLAWVSFRSYKRKQALRYELDMAKEREQGSLALQHATEEERKRIAKDLHDGVGQQIAAIKLIWENLLTKWKKGNLPSKEENQTLSSLIDNTSSDVRSISHRMMPRALQEHGLVEATEEMLRLTLTPAGIDYRLEHFQLPQNLDKRLEISLYRVLQELIKNIVKHSKAKKVGVQLMHVKKHLVLIVEDDGVGMDRTSTDDNGIGILSLKGRVNTVKGTINFGPSPNSGTLVTVRIPLAKNASSTR